MLIILFTDPVPTVKEEVGDDPAELGIWYPDKLFTRLIIEFTDPVPAFTEEVITEALGIGI